MEIKHRCGWHSCSLRGHSHDVKLCPSSILLLHGRQDWYPMTGLWYREVINALAAPPRKLLQYRWAGCRWQAELSARCPVCSDLSRFWLLRGTRVTALRSPADVAPKDARGAIHDFMFPSQVRVIHLQSQHIDTLIRSNHVQTSSCFVSKLWRVVVFWRRHRRPLWSWRGVCDLCTIFSFFFGQQLSAHI